MIGRRFEPELLAVVLGETEIDGRLAAMQALDLIRLEIGQAIMNLSTLWSGTRSIKAC